MSTLRLSCIRHLALSSAIFFSLPTTASGAESASLDPQQVLDGAAGDPHLVELAQAAGVESLRAALADPDPLMQRAAARLLATGIMPPADLLTALVTCTDPEARRLGAAGLLSMKASKESSASLSVADLLRLGDASVVAPLLILHPDPWAGGLARPVVMQWLKDPLTCAQAAGVLMAQAEAATWGSDLVTLLEAPSTTEPVIAATHAVLERLTKTQRSRDTYAGNRDLLAKDWRDGLAARAAQPTKPDAEVLVLIAEAPAPDAIEKLLEQGPAALPALEQAMASATRARRKILQPIARLVARGVTPGLWKALGDEGLKDLDASESRARSACLRAIAAAVRTGHDQAGLIHLVRWLDDNDTRVRANALDLLVRLSDHKIDFGDTWGLGKGKLFPSDQTTWRLRRSLRDGEHDERLAALLFASSLRAAELTDDVVTMVIDADPVVAEAALDALGHLSITHKHLPVLTRLAVDPELPATQRVLACTRVAGLSTSNEVSYVNGKRVIKTADPEIQKAAESLRTLITDPLPTVATAAAKTLLKIDASPSGRKELYALLAGTGRGALLSDSLHDEKDTALLIGLLPQLAPDSESAQAVAQGLIAAIANNGYGTDKGRTRAALRDPVLARATQPAATLPERTVGLVYGAGRNEMIAGFSALPENRKQAVWKVLVDNLPTNVTAWLALVPLAATLSDEDRIRLVRKAWKIAALDPQILTAMANSDQLSLMHAISEATVNDVKTVQLDEATTVVLTSAKETTGSPEDPLKSSEAPIFKSSTNAVDEEDGKEKWRLKVAQPPMPEADLLAMRTALSALSLAEDERAILDVMIAIFGGPAPKLTTNWNQELEGWAVLTTLHPELRPRLAAGLNAAEAKVLNDWSLRQLLVHGNPDLLPVITARWGAAEDYQRRTFSTWMQTLKPEAVRAHLLSLVSTDAGRDAAQTMGILRWAAPLPLPVALRLLSVGKLTVAVEPFTDAPSLLPTLTTALDTLTPAAILAQGNGLTALRTAGPALFDAALATLCTKPTRIAAAWLRTGLPLQYLGREPYEAAFRSPEPHLWVVGAALHLKEGTLSPGDFLTKLPTLPATALADALIVVQRRIADRLADQGPALAAILMVANARDVAAWIEMCPADPSITTALKTRLDAGVPVAIIAPVLASKLRSDRATWEAPIRDLDTATKGQLKALLGALLDPPAARPSR